MGAERFFTHIETALNCPMLISVLFVLGCFAVGIKVGQAVATCAWQHTCRPNVLKSVTFKRVQEALVLFKIDVNRVYDEGAQKAG